MQCPGIKSWPEASTCVKGNKSFPIALHLFYIHLSKIGIGCDVQTSVRSSFNHWGQNREEPWPRWAPARCSEWRDSQTSRGRGGAVVRLECRVRPWLGGRKEYSFSLPCRPVPASWTGCKHQQEASIVKGEEEWCWRTLGGWSVPDYLQTQGLHRGGSYSSPDGLMSSGWMNTWEACRVRKRQILLMILQNMYTE